MKTGLDLIDQLYASYINAKALRDATQTEVNSIGASIQKLDKDRLALEAIGNTDAAYKLALQIDEMSRYFSQLGINLANAERDMKKAFDEWQNTRSNYLTAAEQQASDAVLAANSAALVAQANAAATQAVQSQNTLSNDAKMSAEEVAAKAKMKKILTWVGIGVLVMGFGTVGFLLIKKFSK